MFSLFRPSIRKDSKHPGSVDNDDDDRLLMHSREWQLEPDFSVGNVAWVKNKNLDESVYESDPSDVLESLKAALHDPELGVKAGKYSGHKTKLEPSSLLCQCCCSCSCCTRRCCKRGLFVAAVVVSVAIAAALIFFYVNITSGVRLAFGDSKTEMSVTWATNGQVPAPVVVYRELPPDGIPGEAKRVVGVSDGFSKSLLTQQYINRVYLSDLKPGLTYEYLYGEDASPSDFVNPSANDFDVYQFRVPAVEQQEVSMVAFGDLGMANMAIYPYLKEDTDAKMYDFAFHIGDFAYDLDSFFGLVGDLFLSYMQPVISQLPYMTTPGNHESYWDNLNQYMNRFTMPRYQEARNLWYSFEVGPLKVISMSSEAFYTNLDSPLSEQEQIEWLTQELNATNRTRTPWLITMAHRPMYCSNGDSDCDFGIRNKVRVGLEAALMEYNVTVAFWAHEHSYERTCAVHNGVCVPDDVGLARSFYDSPPGAPIHVITGSAGCVEGHDSFSRGHGPWSRVQDSRWGFGRLKANYTSFKWSQHHIVDDLLTQVDGFEINL